MLYFKLESKTRSKPSPFLYLFNAFIYDGRFWQIRRRANSPRTAAAADDDVGRPTRWTMEAFELGCFSIVESRHATPDEETPPTPRPRRGGVARRQGTAASGRKQHGRHVGCVWRHRCDVIAADTSGDHAASVVVRHFESRDDDVTVRVPVRSLSQQQAHLHCAAWYRLVATHRPPKCRPHVAQFARPMISASHDMSVPAPSFVTTYTTRLLDVEVKSHFVISLLQELYVNFINSL